MAFVESLYTDCSVLLGTSRDGSRFKRLMERLHQQPDVVLQNENSCFFRFPSAGIELVYSMRRDYFVAVVFFIDTPGVRQGRVCRYSDVLLHGIGVGESASNVERSIGTVAEREELDQEFLLRYDLSDRTLAFHFDKTGTQLSLVMLKLKPAVGDPKTVGTTHELHGSIGLG